MSLVLFHYQETKEDFLRLRVKVVHPFLWNRNIMYPIQGNLLGTNLKFIDNEMKRQKGAAVREPMSAP